MFSKRGLLIPRLALNRRLKRARDLALEQPSNSMNACDFHRAEPEVDSPVHNEQQSETKNEGDNLFQPSLADILRDWMISTNVPFSTVNRLNVSLQHKLPELPRDARTLMRTLRSCPTGEVPPGSYSFLQPEERTRARILPDCSSLDRRSREAEVGFEPRTFWRPEAPSG